VGGCGRGTASERAALKRTRPRSTRDPPSFYTPLRWCPDLRSARIFVQLGRVSISDAGKTGDKSEAKSGTSQSARNTRITTTSEDDANENGKQPGDREEKRWCFGES
jgi:hypothetical protein